MSQTDPDPNEELRESEEQYRTLLELSPDAIAIHSKGKIVYVNTAYVHLFGASTKEELVGKPVKDFVPPDRWKLVKERIQRALETKEGAPLQEEQVVRTDGKVIDVEVAGKAVQYRGKVGVLVILRDITDRKEAEKELKKRGAKLERQNVLLNQKHMALREMMEQIREEKQRTEDQIQANVDRLLMPILSKLRGKTLQYGPQVIDLLEDNLNRITSPFGSKISTKMFSLTPKEIETCNMIKSGLTSKEIGGLLNVSYRTVQTHRARIRKKLGVKDKDINLATYLNSL